MITGVLLLCSAAFAALSSPTTRLSLEKLGISGPLQDDWVIDPESGAREVRAKGPDGEVIALTTTPYLVPITPDTAHGAGRLALHRLYRQHAEDVRLIKTAVISVGGMEMAEVLGSGTLAGDRQVVILQRTFTSGTHMVHASVIARDEAQAREALETFSDGLLTVDPPADLSTLTNIVTTADGRTLTLPMGWRAPLPSEKEAIERELRLEGSDCWLGIRPDLAGVDMIRGCQVGLHLGVLNERSLSHVETQVRHTIAGLEETGPAVLTWTGSRPTLTFSPASSGIAERMVVTPTAGGVELLLASSPEREAAALDADLAGMMSLENYPESAYSVTMTDRVMYLTTHRLDLIMMGFSPLLIGGLVVWSRRRGKGWQEMMDEDEALPA